MKLPSRRYIFETLHPDIYHGRRAKRPFFEGWYYKVIDGNGGDAWAIIPGIFKDHQPQRNEAFVMILDGRSNQVFYHNYPVSQFAAGENSFNLRIGPNFFAAEYLTLNLPNLQGHLSFHGLTPWPVSWRAPGIMGWYGWFPMECYHGVLSMDHQVTGFLKYGERRFNIENGRGYIEKDWGRNFPQTWIWLQANQFEKKSVSLTASIARIPFYGRVFPGFIIGLLLDGRLFQFATYLNSTLEEMTLEGGEVRIIVHGKEALLEINGVQGRTTLLHAPTPGQGMVPRVHESVDALVHIRLKDRSGVILYEGESSRAGMEIVGDTSILTSE
jgi:tocopherol cyclase